MCKTIPISVIIVDVTSGRVSSGRVDHRMSRLLFLLLRLLLRLLFPSLCIMSLVLSRDFIFASLQEEQKQEEEEEEPQEQQRSDATTSDRTGLGMAGVAVAVS